MPLQKNDISSRIWHTLCGIHGGTLSKENGMTYRIIIGALLGAGLGAILGYIGRCAGGTCPIACTPAGGIIFGSILGITLASSIPAKPQGDNKDHGSEHVLIVNTLDQLKEIIGSNSVVLVDFHAEWCGPCRRIAPLIDALAGKYAGIATIAKVNVDKNQAAAAAYGVTSIPDVRIFVDGVQREKITGGRSFGKYAEILDRYTTKGKEDAI